jgi:hypothetical protein
MKRKTVVLEKPTVCHDSPANFIFPNRMRTAELANRILSPFGTLAFAHREGQPDCVRRSDDAGAPFLSLAEAAASGLEHDHAVVLIRTNVVLALANRGGIPLQAKLVMSLGIPALTD